MASTLKASSASDRAAFTPAHLLLGAIALAAFLLGSPPHASAGEYTVKVCRATPGAENAIVIADDNRNGEPKKGTIVSECGASVSDIGGLRQRKVGEVSGGEHWTMVAPQDTRFRHLVYERFIVHSGESFMEWALTVPGGLLFHFFDAGAGIPPIRAEEFDLNSTAIRGDLVCPFAACPGGELTVRLGGVDVTLEDEAFPILFGPLVPATARGTAKVSYSATDAGAGIEKSALFVDGVETAGAHDSNEGACERPFHLLVPCKQVINSSFAVDTTGLPDGPHQVQLSVTDASGQETKSGSVTLNVHNAPTNSRRPAISGSAIVGGQLAVDPGAWEGNPSGFAYQWLRCPAAAKLGDTSGCSTISGATDRQYSPTAPDAGQREVVRVTATNAAGTGNTVSAPSDAVAVPTRPGKSHKPPVISHVTLSRKRFRAATPRLTQGRGAVLRFSSSKAGHLTLAIERLRRGKPRPFAKLAAPIKSGRSSVLLSGMIGARRMPPGRYRIVLRVKDAKGVVSAPVGVSFTIRPG